MQDKKIKIFLNKYFSETEIALQKYFPFYVLFKSFNVDIVKNVEDADIIFEGTAVGGKSYLKRKDKIIVVVSGEHIFMKRCLFNWVERVVKIFAGNEKKYKIMDRLDSIIPLFIQKIPLSYFFPEYIRFVKTTNTINKHYIIWCNGNLNKNVYNYPLFLADFHDKLQDLVKKKKIIKKERKKFCAFVVSSNSNRERINFFKKLSKYKKVDSYGKVMNNVDQKIFRDWKRNPELFKDYKFVICFENSFVDDFVTEKITNVMLGGAIPIYRGPKRVASYFNTKSFINYDDLKSEDAMIKKVIELDQNREKYLTMQKEPWFKDDKIPKEIKDKEKELVEFYKRIIANLKK